MPGRKRWALWASLLANHTDPEARVELDRDLIEVVRQLSMVDARLMTYLSEQSLDIIITPCLRLDLMCRGSRRLSR